MSNEVKRYDCINGGMVCSEHPNIGHWVSWHDYAKATEITYRENQSQVEIQKLEAIIKCYMIVIKDILRDER